METSWTNNREAITKNLALSSALAAAYIVSTFLPLTAFVGGAAFITLGIVVVPVIAAVLRPVFASLAIIVGSLGMSLFGTGIYPVFGLFGLLIPIVAVVLGSIAYHHRWGTVIPWVYVLVGLLYYVVFSKGTLLWLLPYVVVIVSLPLAIWSKRSGVILLLALYTGYDGTGDDEYPEYFSYRTRRGRMDGDNAVHVSRADCCDCWKLRDYRGS